jgi:hypothetical protein
MNRFFSCLLFIFIRTAAAQEPDELELNNDPAAYGEAHLNIAEEMEEEYAGPAININTASEDALLKLGMNPLQANSLINYRRLMGPLIDLHELQAVANFSVEGIRKIMSYVLVRPEAPTPVSLMKLIKAADQKLNFYAGGELSKILKKDTAYEGSGLRLLASYRMQYPNRLSISLLGEKDAGESFFRGWQRQGFDYYSAHICYSGKGIMKTLLLGDFVVNMGQGLIQWQSLAFGKTLNAGLLKKQSPVLKPYQSAGEFNFHRGIGITLEQGANQLTVFVSKRSLDATLANDSLNKLLVTVKSIRTSGFHRNESESRSRGLLDQTTGGLALKGKLGGLSWGLNTSQRYNSLPMDALRGLTHFFYANDAHEKYWSNFSADWGYTHKNFHFYGETAVDRRKNKALLTGLLISLSSNAEAAVIYRNLGKGYRADQSAVFSEYGGPGNEQGLFMALNIRASPTVQFNVFADHFQNAWLSYRLSRPFRGNEYVAEFRYKPAKKTECYVRVLFNRKGIDENDAQQMTGIQVQESRGWRIGLDHEPFPGWQFRFRSESRRVGMDRGLVSRGEYFLAYLAYKPLMKRFSVSLSMVYFRTDDWDSRLYVLERGLLPGYSAAALSGDGYRFQWMMRYQTKSGFKVGFNIMQSFTERIAGNLFIGMHLQFGLKVY